MLKPNYIRHENGKDYRVIDRTYVEQQMGRKGPDGELIHPTVTAQKKACLIARPAVEGEQITVYNATGEVEAKETCTAGNWVVKSVDLDGAPILTDAGQENIWQTLKPSYRFKRTFAFMSRGVKAALLFLSLSIKTVMSMLRILMICMAFPAGISIICMLLKLSRLRLTEVAVCPRCRIWPMLTVSNSLANNM